MVGETNLFPAAERSYIFRVCIVNHTEIRPCNRNVHSTRLYNICCMRCTKQLTSECSETDRGAKRTKTSATIQSAILDFPVLVVESYDVSRNVEILSHGVARHCVGFSIHFACVCVFCLWFSIPISVIDYENAVHVPVWKMQYAIETNTYTDTSTCANTEKDNKRWQIAIYPIAYGRMKKPRICMSKTYPNTDSGLKAQTVYIIFCTNTVKRFDERLLNISTRKQSRNTEL